MKRILATLTLTCVLSISALAGEIPTCNPTPPGATTTGDVPIAGSDSEAGNVPTGDFSGLLSETDSSVLTDILLTFVNLIVR